MPFQVPQPPGLGGELLQHARQLASMQSRQTRFQGIGAGLVVKLGVECQLMLAGLDDTIAMARLIPVTGFLILDASDDAFAIMNKGSINGLWYKEVGNIVEAWCRLGGPVNIGAVLVAVPDGKQHSLVLILEMR